MPVPSNTRDRANPYRLAHGPITDYAQAQGAAIDLAMTLLLAGVKKRLVNQIMIGALRRHYPNEIPGGILRALLTEAVNDAKMEESKVRSIDKQNDLDGQKRSGIEAVACVLRAYFKDWRVDTDYKEIDCRWTGLVDDGPEPGPITIPFGRGSLTEATAALFRHLGPPELFVAQVYGTAKPKDLLPAFLLCAQKAPHRDKAHALSEAAELVLAIVNMQIWHNIVEDTPVGQRTRQTKIRPEATPGIYPSYGIAYIASETTSDMMLYVLPNAVLNHLPDHFRRNRRPGEIRDLLFRAPGYRKTTKEGYSCPNRVREAFGNWRTVEINMRLFREALDQAEQHAANPPQPKALDPDEDGRDPAVIVTPYSASPTSAADHTAYMLSVPAHPSEPLRSAGSQPQAHTAQQPSLTLFVSENPQSSRGDGLVSEVDRDRKVRASVQSGENLSDSGWMESHGGSHK